MKIYLCILFFSLNQVFANNTLSGKGLICNYGSDEDMYEVGQDYAYMVKVPFVFKEHQEFDLAIA